MVNSTASQAGDRPLADFNPPSIGEEDIGHRRRQRAPTTTFDRNPDLIQVHG